MLMGATADAAIFPTVSGASSVASLTLLRTRSMTSGSDIPVTTSPRIWS